MTNNTPDRTSAPWWFWASVVATALLCLPGLIARHQAEAANRAVGIVVEASTVQAMALASGQTKDQTFAQLAEAGVNVAALSESYLGDLVRTGSATIERTSDGGSLVTLTEPTFLQSVDDLAQLVGGTRLEDGQFEFDQSPDALLGLSVGLDPLDAAIATASGMQIIARHGNPENAPDGYIDYLVANAQRFGATMLLPSGDSVPGFKHDIKEFKAHIESGEMMYVGAEFVKTAGDSGIKGQFPENTLLLHAAQSAELVRMDPEAVDERYSKAFRERNVRLLLVRPNDPAGGMEAFTKQISKLKASVEADGGAVKTPRPFVGPKPNSALTLGCALVAVPAALWTAFQLFTALGATSQLRRTLLIGVGVIVVGVSLASFRESFRPLTALMYTLAFPIAAYAWFLTKPSRPTVLSYLGISAISLVGGLQVAGNLIGSKYMAHAAIFPGVKMQVFLPILVVLVLMLAAYRPLRTFKADPITWGGGVAAIVGLGALMFMNARTGNDNAGAVSGLELRLRDLLDQTLPVRPRTKEFMIGHPALIVGLGLYVASLRRAASPTLAATLLVAFSAIGQTSVVNTLCHLHTPVELSLLRIVSGHVAGCIIGLALWGAVSLMLRQKSGQARNETT